MRRLRAGRVGALTAAVMLLAAACADDDGGGQGVEPDAGEVVDVEGESDDLGTVDPGAGPLDGEDAVTPDRPTDGAVGVEDDDATQVGVLWREFLVAADAFDNGDTSFEPVAALLTGQAAEQAEGWEAAYVDGPHGERVPMDTRITFVDGEDDVATIAECVWDNRWVLDDFPQGYWHQVTGEATRTADGWRISGFVDPLAFGLPDGMTPCVPSEVEDDLRDLTLFITQEILSLGAPRHAPAFDNSHFRAEGRLSGRGSMADVNESMRNVMIEQNAYARQIAFMDSVLMPNAQPALAAVTVCVYGDPTDFYDQQTDELLGSGDNAADSLYIVTYGRRASDNQFVPIHSGWDTSVSAVEVCGDPDGWPIQFDTAFDDLIEWRWDD